MSRYSAAEINREQRIVLIAEAYDYEVLVGAEWLHNKYDLDILCCRISLSTDSASGVEYLRTAAEFVNQNCCRGRLCVGWSRR